MARILNHGAPTRISKSRDIGLFKARVNIVDYIAAALLVDDPTFELAKFNGDDEYRCLCPFHDEMVGSFSIYYTSQQFYCYGCGEHGDVLDFVIIRNEGVNDVMGAMKFLESTNALESVAKYPITSRTKASLGPIDPAQLATWHAQLLDRTWLYDRLITDRTIDRYQLGYVPSKEAIAIPFWQGLPGASPVKIVQMRSLRQDSKRKYFGYKGFYGSALFNQDFLSTKSDYIIVLFGTFDAMLARQDGVLAVSPNGANVYRSEWTEPFQQFEKVYIVPDKGNANEVKAAQQFAAKIGPTAYVRSFPDGDWGKDYTDWRMDGGSAYDFVDHILDTEQDRSF